jgi:hypothetical protein
MKEHDLKTDTEPFREVWRGNKTAEFRREDNKTFNAGDIVHLHEQEDGEYTGYSITVKITHVQRGYGIPEGYAMLSFIKIDWAYGEENKETE